MRPELISQQINLNLIILCKNEGNFRERKIVFQWTLFNFFKPSGYAFILATVFILFIYFNWRLVTLQYCGFCHTLTWINGSFAKGGLYLQRPISWVWINVRFNWIIRKTLVCFWSLSQNISLDENQMPHDLQPGDYAYWKGGGASQVALVVKSPPANAGDLRDAGSIPV